MTKITIEKKQVDELFKRLQNDSGIKKSVLNNIGIYGKRVLQNEADDISATNKLFNSTSYSIKGEAVEIGAYVPYAYEAFETGTPPGTNVNKSDLERWAAIKLGDKGIAGAIARKIKKEGTKKWRTKYPKQFTRAVDTINLMLPREIARLAKYYTQ